MCSEIPDVLAQRFVTGWVQSWQQLLSGAQLVSPSEQARFANTQQGKRATGGS